jgi:hypothetical protein
MRPRDDAALTANERASLAELEAKAAAEDPLLARRLRGSRRPVVIGRLCRVPMWRGRAWWGPSLILIGLALVALSLSTVWALGVAGLLFTASGLGIVAAAVERRRSKPSSAGPT